MCEREIISLLRHKRHDWMNQIQLIQGYASLNNQDRLMDQIDEIKEEAEQERRLLNSDAVHFPIWLLSFNWYHEQFRLKYTVNNDVDLSRHDSTIFAYGKRIIELMHEHKRDDELYEGTLFIHQELDQHSLGFSWEWQGRFMNPERLQQRMNEEGFLASMLEDTELVIEMIV